MNRMELNRWWDDYQAKFPSAARWLNTLTEQQRREIFAAWSDLLAPALLSDALEVNRLMRSGAIAEVGSFDHDREKIGHAVRSECDNMARQRRPKPVPDWQAERYKCVLCLDTGLVEAFRRDWLKWLSLQDEIPASFHDANKAGWKRGRPTQMVFCRCAAADAIIYRGPEEKAPRGIPKTRVNTPDSDRYSKERFYRVPHGLDMHASEWRKAVDWWHGHATGAERHYDEFEAWNTAGVIPLRPQVEFKKP